MEATLHRPVDGDERDSFDQSGGAALEDLYNDHSSWLIAMLTRRYGAEAADDLAQETYVRLATSPPTEVLRNPRSFLLHIAQNLARNWLRSRRRRPTEPLDERDNGALPIDGPQLEAVLFRQILLALPPKLRDVFLLNHVRGMTHQEIARVLGISVKTVEKRMSKAVALCAAAMRD